MIAIVMSFILFSRFHSPHGNSHSSHMAAAAGGIIFCKVFGENILSFGGVCRHPIGDVTFGIIFCRGPNSTQQTANSVREAKHGASDPAKRQERNRR